MATDRLLQKIAFGGGCHWCTEAVFAALKGVSLVEQGWVAADDMDFSEAVIAHFDPEKIELEDLIRVHLHTHSSTSMHTMRVKYRSAVYYFSDKQKQAVEQALFAAQAEFELPLVTLALPFRAFRPSPEQYRDYYRKNPDKPFCEQWISPKLRLLREKFTDKLHS